MVSADVSLSVGGLNKHLRDDSKNVGVGGAPSNQLASGEVQFRSESRPKCVNGRGRYLQFLGDLFHGKLWQKSCDVTFPRAQVFNYRIERARNPQYGQIVRWHPLPVGLHCPAAAGVEHRIKLVSHRPRGLAKQRTRERILHFLAVSRRGPVPGKCIDVLLRYIDLSPYVEPCDFPAGLMESNCFREHGTAEFKKALTRKERT